MLILTRKSTGAKCFSCSIMGQGLIFRIRRKLSLLFKSQLIKRTWRIFVWFVVVVISTLAFVSSHSGAAVSLSNTIHYAMKHSVWEFAIQMYPYVLKNSLNSNSMNSSIGFTFAVVDSFGHTMLFPSLGQHSEMIFISTLAPQAVLVPPMDLLCL